MKKNNIHRMILLFFTAIILSAVFWKFSTLLYFPDSGVALEKGEEFKLQPKASLLQLFAANRDGLSKIELLFRTPGPKLPDVVEMQLLDESCSNKINNGILEKSFISSGNLYEFVFPRITDSKNKIYCLKAIFKPEKLEAKPIKFFMKEEANSELWLKDQSSGKKIENQSLSMRAAYKNENVIQDFNELNQRISQYKPWFLKHHFLHAIVFLFLALSAGIIILLILM